MHLFTQEIAKAYAYNYKTIAIQSTQSISKLVAGRVQTGQTCSASCPIPGEVHCERVKQPCTRHLGVQRLWQPVLVLRFYIKLIYIYMSSYSVVNLRNMLLPTREVSGCLPHVWWNKHQAMQKHTPDAARAQSAGKVCRPGVES